MNAISTVSSDCIQNWDLLTVLTFIQKFQICVSRLVLELASWQQQVE